MSSLFIRGWAPVHNKNKCFARFALTGRRSFLFPDTVRFRKFRTIRVDRKAGFSVSTSRVVSQLSRRPHPACYSMFPISSCQFFRNFQLFDFWGECYTPIATSALGSKNLTGSQICTRFIMICGANSAQDPCQHGEAPWRSPMLLAKPRETARNL